MKPENLNEKTTENMSELTPDELDGVSGGLTTGQSIIGAACGGLMVLVGSETGSDFTQTYRKVASKYQ